MSDAGAMPFTLTEETLVGRAQDGDVSAFEELLRRHSTGVLRLAYRMLGDRGEAEDVVQDTFVLVWRQLPALNELVSFRSWVYQIAVRRCLDVVRTRDRRRTVVAPDADLEASQDSATGRPPGSFSPAGGGDDPALLTEHAAQLQGLEQLLQTLPEEQRACWVLHEMHELTYTEIAFATRLPVSTVRGRIARARQNLAKGMAPWR